MTTSKTYTLSLHDALPIYRWHFTGTWRAHCRCSCSTCGHARSGSSPRWGATRSEEHTSELQSLTNLVCRLLLEKKYRPMRSVGLRSSSPAHVNNAPWQSPP